MQLEIGLFKTEKNERKKKRKEKKPNCIKSAWAIPIPISTTKDVICCSNKGYIYH